MSPSGGRGLCEISDKTRAREEKSLVRDENQIRGSPFVFSSPAAAHARPSGDLTPGPTNHDLPPLFLSPSASFRGSSWPSWPKALTGRLGTITPAD